MVDREESEQIAIEIVKSTAQEAGVSMSCEQAEAIVKAFLDTFCVIVENAANQLMKLFDALESADAIFKSCQSDSFRQQVRSIYTAPNIQNAYDDLREQIRRLKTREVPP